MHLIPMTDFVLQQSKIVYRLQKKVLIFTEEVVSYAEFLKQPTRKDMFYGDKKLFVTNLSDGKIAIALERHHLVEDLLKDWGFKLTGYAESQIFKFK